jgi:hypothetical protein
MELIFFHIKFLSRTNIKCQNGSVLPPTQVFYFNGQALHYSIEVGVNRMFYMEA